MFADAVYVTKTTRLASRTMLACTADMDIDALHITNSLVKS
jgi:hypothetical protein